MSVDHLQQRIGERHQATSQINAAADQPRYLTLKRWEVRKEVLIEKVKRGSLPRLP
ncbi:hypothetical protein [Endozoicomonas arenosclerae]|uniref:hypothetical protein n=1 Tax=Endozoicomonas arenosclerae TaxID=1633495 RepID=UPI000A55361D|nr:hypothetical protein [Endozoicomonas arenosclerae]